MELGLDARTAIVCGASAGLGLASAEALAREGANVAMFARRRDLLEREAERIGALAVRGDVTSAPDLERLVARTLEAFGGIDIVVWNSGGPPAGTATEVTDETLEAAFALLLVSAVRLVRLCLPHLERSRPAGSCSSTSIAVTRAVSQPRALERAPARRRRLGEDARARARAEGDHRQHVAPGRIDTRGWSSSTAPPARRARRSRRSRSAASASRDEFGDVVCFLASDRASYVTGAVIPVDGGATRGLL